MVILPNRRKAFRLAAEVGEDSDIYDYQLRLAAAGGSISSLQLSAVRDFVIALKNNDIWDKIDRLNLFCGKSLTSALVPQKIAKGNTLDSNNGLTNYLESSGITGDGSHYLDTGVSILGLDKSDFSMGTFNVNVVNTGVRFDIGSSYVATGDTNRLYLGSIVSSTGSIYWGLGSSFESPRIIGTSLNNKIVAVETTSTNQARLYNAGELCVLLGWNNNGFQSGSINLFRGAGGNYSLNTLGGYFIGKNLDQATLQSLYTAFITAIGR